MVEALAARMAADPALPMATIATPIARRGGVALAARREGGRRTGRRALYFSRSPVPLRSRRARPADEPLGWRHIGLYAYRRDVLLRLAALPPTPLERARAARAAARARERDRDRRRGVARRGARSRSTRRTIWSGRDERWAARGGGARQRAERAAMTQGGDEDQVHLRDRRRRVVARQGPGVGVDRRAARERAGSKVTHREDGPVHQRRPGHDEPVPARRGVRHRRRRRDRPRSRPLRALRLDAHEPEEQLHHRPGLRHGDREGAPRRLPRRDGAGDPAHHRRDQSAASARPPRATTSASARSAAPSATSRACRSSRRSASSAGTVGRENVALRPPDAGAVHRHRRRAEDQADAAQREGAHRASASSPTSCSAAPTQPLEKKVKAKIALFCNVDENRVITAPRRRAASTRCRSCSTRRASTSASSSSSTSGPARRTSRAGDASCRPSKNPKDTVRIAMVGKYVDLTDSYKSLNEALVHGGIANECRSRSTTSTPRRSSRTACPTASARADGDPRADGLRAARHRGQDRRGALRAREEGAVLRHLLRHADGGDRVRAPRLRPRARELDRGRPADAASGDRPDAEQRRRHAEGRHDAARRLSVRARARASLAREALRQAARSPSATAIATSSTTRTASSSSRHGLVLLGRVARRRRWSR